MLIWVLLPLQRIMVLCPEVSMSLVSPESVFIHLVLGRIEDAFFFLPFLNNK